jgi:hypothetical protein
MAMKSSPFRAMLATLLMAVSFGAAAQGFGVLRFEGLERELRLKPDQKVQFDLAVGATQRALLSVGLVVFQQKQRVMEELAKPLPDLNVLAQSQEALLEMVRPNFREARDEWSRLYALLEPDQVAIAKAYVEKQIGVLESAGARLLGGLRDKPRP